MTKVEIFDKSIDAKSDKNIQIKILPSTNTFDHNLSLEIWFSALKKYLQPKKAYILDSHSRERVLNEFEVGAAMRWIKKIRPTQAIRIEARDFT